VCVCVCVCVCGKNKPASSQSTHHSIISASRRRYVHRLMHGSFGPNKPASKWHLDLFSCFFYPTTQNPMLYGAFQWARQPPKSSPSVGELKWMDSDSEFTVLFILASFRCLHYFTPLLQYRQHKFTAKYSRNLNNKGIPWRQVITTFHKSMQSNH